MTILLAHLRESVLGKAVVICFGGFILFLVLMNMLQTLISYVFL